METEARCLTPKQLLRMADTLVFCEMLRTRVSRTILDRMGTTMRNAPVSRAQLVDALLDSLPAGTFGARLTVEEMRAEVYAWWEQFKDAVTIVV